MLSFRAQELVWPFELIFVLQLLLIDEAIIHREKWLQVQVLIKPGSHERWLLLRLQAECIASEMDQNYEA